jgi:DNA-binding transcriptional LysR family regulator
MLHYFGEVAHCGSVRLAADRLYVAPSAISRQIVKLEEHIGSPLFERRSDGMRLTEAGRLLAAHLAKTERDLGRTLTAVSDLRGMSSGEVSIATVEGMIDEFLPRLLEAYQSKFRAIALKVRVDSALAVMEAVAADESDIGISFNVPSRKSLRVVAQHTQPIVAVCSPSHPLAATRRASLRKLDRYALAIQDSTFGIRRLLDDAYIRARHSLEPHLVTNSLLLLKSLAKQGGVVTFLPTFSVLREVERGELLAIPTDSGILNSAHLDLCIHAPRKLSSAAQEFLGLTEAALARLS